jgi:translocon-associated protein subunit alpha
MFLLNQLEPMVCLLNNRNTLNFLFLELIAGKLTRLLVGTRNNGSQNFIVESIDGSLRYPQDYSYYIQNFTTLRSEKLVEPGSESTFEYLFMPSETFNGRPMGLVVLINYRNNV